MTDPAVLSKLEGLIGKALASTDQQPADLKIESDTFLPEILDSIGLTALIALIEEEWGFEIADEEIEPGIFESVHTLGTFVEHKIASL